MTVSVYAFPFGIATGTSSVWTMALDVHSFFRSLSQIPGEIYSVLIDLFANPMQKDRCTWIV
jgi:hypothetical protein